MKAPAILLLAFVLPSVQSSMAQQTRIVGLTTDGFLSWTSSVANGYYGIEIAPSLLHDWNPMAEEMWSKPTLGNPWGCNVQGGLTNLFRDLPMEMASILGSPFFRVVTSSGPIPAPRITLAVASTNQSDAAVSNLVLGVIEHWAKLPVYECTNLPSASGTPSVLLSISYPFSITSGCGTVFSDGWYVHYDENGLQRHWEQLMPFLRPLHVPSLLTITNGAVEFRHPLGYTIRKTF